MRRRKFTVEERKYLSQVAITCSQVTFAIFWAAILLLPPAVDANRITMIIFNLAASLIFWFCGWILIRRR